jgi:hypothetical protein
VLSGGFIASGIVCHPPGHLGERGRGGEHSSTIPGRERPDEIRCDIVMQIAHHRGVEMAATNLPVSNPERS